MRRKLKRRWIPELPDLREFKRMAVDIETNDPDLKELGCGVRRDGYMVGLSVAGKTEQGESKAWYIPCRHETGENLEPEKVIAWAKEELGREKQDKVFANCMYDLDYLEHEGIDVKGKILDVQLAEPLLDENARKYNLERLSHKYLGVGKYESEMEQFIKEKLGPKADIKSNMWLIPPRIVRKYAEIDAVNPLEIFEAQEKLIKEQGLEYIFGIETDLIPMLLRMKRNGVRVDVDKTTVLYDQYQEHIKENKKRLNEIAGYDVNFNAGDSIAIYCDANNIKYNLTAKTKKPSFIKDWMSGRPEEFFQLIVDLKQDHKVSGTFFDGYILNYAVNGRVHGQFNQLKSDEGGTVSGRFSSSKPNLQNLPSPEKKIGNVVRQLFLPEEDEEWCSIDLRQIEPRVTLHYCNGKDATEAKAAFWADPEIDSYQSIVDNLPQYTRKMLKTVYLGSVYGMGLKSTCMRLGLSDKEGRQVVDDFHASVPYVKALMNRVKSVAEQRGYIRTLMGRRRRFDTFEPTNVPWNKRKNYPALPYEEALKTYGNKIARAYCYKALNSLIQGGSADLMKKMMVDSWNMGLYDVLTPLVTVHDEMGVSKPKTKEGEEAVKELENCMINAWKELTVPLACDVQFGANWGEIA